MNAILTARWRIDATTPPCPHRHCTTCGTTRPFRSSGKVRLNANGRRLDAWLIYKCAVCDRTWNRPVLERAARAGIADADLAAMQASDPAWVRAQAFDLTALRRHCDRIDGAAATALHRTIDGDARGPWSELRLVIEASEPAGDRLDRLLARELGLVRTVLHDMARAGALTARQDVRRVLRRPAAGQIELCLLAARLTGDQHAAVVRALAGSG
jgi:hypothetical protein